MGLSTEFRVFLVFLWAFPALISLFLALTFEIYEAQSQTPRFFDQILQKSFSLPREVSEPLSFDSRHETGLAFLETFLSFEEIESKYYNIGGKLQFDKELWSVVVEEDYCERSFLNLWDSPALKDVNLIFVFSSWNSIPLLASQQFGVDLHPKIHEDRKIVMKLPLISTGPWHTNKWEVPLLI